MSRICDICGKRPQVGYKVSHAHNKSKKLWLPNLQRVKTVQNGQTKRMKVCTGCLKTGLITK